MLGKEKEWIDFFSARAQRKMETFPLSSVHEVKNITWESQTEKQDQSRVLEVSRKSIRAQTQYTLCLFYHHCATSLSLLPAYWLDNTLAPVWRH